MLKAIRAGFGLRDYSRRLVIRLVDPRSFSFARSDGPRIQTISFLGLRYLISSSSSGAGVHTDQLAEILSRVSRTPLGEDCESGS